MKVGRKLFDGKDEAEVLQKLETAWKLGCPDNEAAAYADISYSALNQFLARNPVISERRKRLKETPIYNARKTLSKAIDEGAADLALKYLERKLRAEFALKVENEHSGRFTAEIKDIRDKISDPETQKLADELIRKTSDIKSGGSSQS